MQKYYKIFIFGLMSFALIFGFLHLFISKEFLPYNLNFERLHIFFFNLCASGSLLLTYTLKKVSKLIIIFLLLAMSYALSAFFEYYIVSIILAILLAVIVEKVRIKKFQFIPKDFFSKEVSISAKFHQAALLCLSLALFFSAVVILNNFYLHYIEIKALKLNTFFLAFSFPISLITMSIIFQSMPSSKRIKISKKIYFLKTSSFWMINVGVIIFFIFILLENLFNQMIVTSLLFTYIMIIFYLFIKLTIHNQQKHFLSSGMGFLLVTAITGMLYIYLKFFPEYYNVYADVLIRIHAFSSLYGWNLSGLAIIVREDNFPIQLNSKCVISLHWLTVLILAPVGYYYSYIAVFAVVGYTIVLYKIFFSKSIVDNGVLQYSHNKVT